MPRQRSPNRDKAFELWQKHNGDITNRQIAEMLEENEKTIAVWKQRDKWGGNVVQQTKSKKKNVVQQTTKEKKQTTQKKQARKIEPVVELVIENDELTEKQRLFCLHFIKCFNATKAYQKAYGCSYESAGSAGFRLLQNVKIQAEINRLKQAKMNQAMLSTEDIFQKFMDIAFADITDYVAYDSELDAVSLRNLSEVDGTLITEIRQGRDGATVKLADKMKALEWLADHMDMATPVQKAQLEKLRAETNRMKEDKDTGEKTVTVILPEAVKRFAE